MYIWKFILPFSEPFLLEGKEYRGLYAVAIAHTEEEAIAVLKKDAQEHGDDFEWLDFVKAKQEELPTYPKAIVWAEI